MAVMYVCTKCNSQVFHLKENGPHIGLYCSNGHFITWVNKKLACNPMKDGTKPTAMFIDDLHVENTDDDVPWRN